MASFRLETATMLASDLDVEVMLDYEGNFFADSEKNKPNPRKVSIQAGTRSKYWKFLQ